MKYLAYMNILFGDNHVQWPPENMKLSGKVITHSSFAVSLFVR